MHYEFYDEWRALQLCYVLGTELAEALGFDLSSMEKRQRGKKFFQMFFIAYICNTFSTRLQSLEKKILTEAGETPAIVYEMKRQVESFREKLEVDSY